MTCSVIFRPAAVADLEALEDFVALRSGAQRAEAYVDRIEVACRRLAHLPNRGRDRGDIAAGLRTSSFERRAVIAFRVIEEAVEIAAVPYGGRDLTAALKER